MSDKTEKEVLAELQARREAAAKRRESTRAKATLAQAVRDAENEEALADLEEKYGPCYPEGSTLAKVHVHGNLVVLRRDAEVLFKRFARDCEAIERKKKPLEDAVVDRFILPCIVHPAEPMKLLEEFPGARFEICSALQTLYGLKAKEDEGK
jgi:hypothetical protein